jgi:hypothetical protein
VYGGTVTVTARHHFAFMPVFQAVLAGAQYVSYLEGPATLTTTAREYSE